MFPAYCHAQRIGQVLDRPMSIYVTLSWSYDFWNSIHEAVSYLSRQEFKANLFQDKSLNQQQTVNICNILSCIATSGVFDRCSITPFNWLSVAGCSGPWSVINTPASCLSMLASTANSGADQSLDRQNMVIGVMIFSCGVMREAM